MSANIQNYTGNARGLSRNDRAISCNDYCAAWSSRRVPSKSRSGAKQPGTPSTKISAANPATMDSVNSSVDETGFSIASWNQRLFIDSRTFTTPHGGDNFDHTDSILQHIATQFAQSAQTLSYPVESFSHDVDAALEPSDTTRPVEPPANGSPAFITTEASREGSHRSMRSADTSSYGPNEIFADANPPWTPHDARVDHRFHRVSEEVAVIEACLNRKD